MKKFLLLAVFCCGGLAVCAEENPGRSCNKSAAKCCSKAKQSEMGSPLNGSSNIK